MAGTLLEGLHRELTAGLSQGSRMERMSRILQDPEGAHALSQRRQDKEADGSWVQPSKLGFMKISHLRLVLGSGVCNLASLTHQISAPNIGGRTGTSAVRSVPRDKQNARSTLCSASPLFRHNHHSTHPYHHSSSNCPSYLVMVCCIYSCLLPPIVSIRQFFSITS